MNFISFFKDLLAVVPDSVFFTFVLTKGNLFEWSPLRLSSFPLITS
jgi:hypothetical protein